MTSKEFSLMAACLLVAVYGSGFSWLTGVTDLSLPLADLSTFWLYFEELVIGVYVGFLT